jgi:hypothetical protein
MPEHSVSVTPGTVHDVVFLSLQTNERNETGQATTEYSVLENATGNDHV